MAGGIACLLNGWWQSEELAEAIDDVGCTLVFADPSRTKRLGAIEGLTIPVFEIDDLLPLAKAMASVTHSWPRVPLPALTGDDHATILFTSGSTGQSKGALSDHRAVLQAVFNYLTQALVMLGIATADGKAPEGQPATLLNVPLFHVTGRGAGVPPELRDGPQARADAQMGCRRGDAADRGRGDQLFRRRAADELRDPRPTQSREI